MIKGIIFDLDNTLVDFTRFKENSIKSAIESMIDAGLKIDPETAYKKIFQIYEEKGWEYQKVFDDFLIEIIGYIDYKILASGIVAYRRAKEGSLVLYPNVTRTLLNLVKKGVKLAVVSDAPALQVWTRLVQMNLHHIFDVVITFDDTGKRKPEPEPFLKALEKLNLNPEEVIMVGDWAERDIVGAKKVGIKTIFAKYGNTFGTINSGAGEIGHIIIDENGPLCNCGNMGCIEAYIGEAYFPNYFEKFFKRKLKALEIYELAKNNNNLAIEFWKWFSNKLSILINNLIMIFEPDVIVLRKACF